MNKFKPLKRMMGVFIILSLFILVPVVVAKENGQIININQNYQIAFTDLGNRVLKQGDVVKVLLNSDDFVYMQVLESSMILSKLGPSTSERFHSDIKDFQRVSVGNPVSKIEQIETQPIIKQNVIPTDSAIKVQKLEQDLEQAKQQLKYLQEANDASRAKLEELNVANQIKNKEAEIQTEKNNSKEALEQIKVHLNNMHKLVNENN